MTERDHGEDHDRRLWGITAEAMGSILATFLSSRLQHIGSSHSWCTAERFAAPCSRNICGTYPEVGNVVPQPPARLGAHLQTYP